VAEDKIKELKDHVLLETKERMRAEDDYKK